MSNWGYVLKDMAGNRMYEEFGFESKSEAEEQGKEKLQSDFPDCMYFVKTEQRWDDPV